MPAPRKQPAKRKPPAEPNVHLGKGAVAVKAGTSDREVHAALTGEDQLPEKGMELGREPGRPEFDPTDRAHEVEVEEPDKPAIITTMVFVGTDDGTYEDRLRAIIAYAEGKDLVNMTATVGALDPDVYEAIIGG